MGRGKRQRGLSPAAPAGERHGFIHTYRQGLCRKSLYINGYRAVTYRYPRIKPRFTSPLVNEDNLHLCGGWTWPAFKREWPYKVSHPVIIERVIAGVKPLGEAAAREGGQEELEELQERAQAADLETLLERRNNSNFPWQLGVARRETFGELFDLVALTLDWVDYTRGLDAGYAADILELFRSVSGRPASDFLGADWDLLPAPLTGLILGYPVETSAAIYCRDAGLPDAGVS